MPQVYVTWYTMTVFIVPFCIVTYTHILICHEIWLNWHSKRQSLMIKEHHTTRAPNSKESYFVVNNTSSGLRLENHSMPHSPLPGSKQTRHSLANPSNFFTKATTPIGVDTTTTLNRNVTSKCSRTFNRLLWICHKSSSVSSNSSAVSTSTNSSASSHRSCSPASHLNGHRHSHRSRHHHHHYSTPTLNLTTNLCPLHDKLIQQHRLSCEDSDRNCLTTAHDTTARSNGPLASHLIHQGKV